VDFHHIGEIGSSAWTFITTPAFVRAYLLLGGLAALGAALAFAYLQFCFIREIEDPIEWIEEQIRLKRVNRGRPPVLPAAVERRRKRIARIKRNAWIAILLRLVALFVFGYVVPFFVMAIGVYWYRFLEPGTAPFVDSVTNQPIDQPTLQIAISFVVDQLSRGAASDYMELYNIAGFTQVVINPNAHWIRPVCLLFRYFVEGFSAAIPLFILRSLWALAFANFKRTAVAGAS
jgi:hypothetical protein